MGAAGGPWMAHPRQDGGLPCPMDGAFGKNKIVRSHGWRSSATGRGGLEAAPPCRRHCQVSVTLPGVSDSGGGWPAACLRGVVRHLAACHPPSGGESPHRSTHIGVDVSRCTLRLAAPKCGGVWCQHVPPATTFCCVLAHLAIRRPLAALMWPFSRPFSATRPPHVVAQV